MTMVIFSNPFITQFWFSKLFQTTSGYRYIGIDYDKGEGAERFLYNIDTYGWVVHFGFNF